MGGSSAEREISIRSGDAVVNALRALGYQVTPVVLGVGDAALLQIASAQLDVAFLALHGRLGEDGCVQGLLEMLGDPVHRLERARERARHGQAQGQGAVPALQRAHAAVLRGGANDELAELEALHGSFGFPVIVKPRSEGSSLGVAQANDLAELAARSKPRGFDSSVIVERFVAGVEINVGILDGRVLGAIEIARRAGIYDYEAKYTPGMTEYFMPARLAAPRDRAF